MVLFSLLQPTAGPSLHSSKGKPEPWGRHHRTQPGGGGLPSTQLQGGDQGQGARGWALGDTA